MVGRLVKHQHIGAAEHYLNKGKSGFFATRQRTYIQKNVFISEKKSAQERAHLCIGVESVGLLELFKHCVCRIEKSLPLIVICKRHIISDFDSAAVRFNLIKQDFEKCCFAHSVRSHYTDPLSSLDIKIHIAKQFFALRTVSEAF